MESNNLGNKLRGACRLAVVLAIVQYFGCFKSSATYPWQFTIKNVSVTAAGYVWTYEGGVLFSASGIAPGQTVTNHDSPGSPTTIVLMGGTGPSDPNPYVIATMVNSTPQSSGYVNVGVWQNDWTYCHLPVNVYNSGTVPQMFAITQYGAQTGNFLYVPAGQAATTSVISSNCDLSNWSYEPIGNGSITGPSQNLGNGVTQIAGGVSQNLVPTGPAQNIPSPGPGLPNSLEYSPQIIPYISLTNNNAPYNNPNQVATNGPINFGTNTLMAGTNGANNGTIEESSDAIYSAITQGNTATENLLNQIASNTAKSSSGGGGSNNITISNYVSVTNTSDYTNLLTQIASNTGALNNLFQAAATNTNIDYNGIGSFASNFANSNWLVSNALAMATNALGSMASASNSFASGVATNASVSGPGDMTIRYAIGSTTYNFDFDPAHMPIVAPLVAWIRLFVGYVAAFFFVYAVVDLLLKYIKTLPQSQQMRAPDAQVELLGVGGNVGIFAVIVYFLVMVTVLAMLPIILDGFLTSGWGFGVGNGIMSVLGVNPLSGQSGVVGMAIGLANEFLPLDFLLGLVVAYLVDYMGIAMVHMVATSLIRAMVG